MLDGRWNEYSAVEPGRLKIHCPTELLNAIISTNGRVVIRSNLLREIYLSLSALFCTTRANEAVLSPPTGKSVPNNSLFSDLGGLLDGTFVMINPTLAPPVVPYQVFLTLITTRT